MVTATHTASPRAALVALTLTLLLAGHLALAQQTPSSSAAANATTPAPSTAAPPACQQELLSTVPALCQANAGLTNISATEQCKFVCAVCLSAVLTVSAGSCSSYLSVQTSFSAQCQACFTQAPPSTTEAPTTEPPVVANGTTAAPTTEAPTTTAAPGSPGLTTIGQGTVPPSSTDTEAPIGTESPAPTPAPLPDCHGILLRITSAACNVSLPDQGVVAAPGDGGSVNGTFSGEQCAAVCQSSCFNTLLGVPGCGCSTFENLQAWVVDECLSSCFSATANTTAVPATTVVPVTTSVTV